MYSLLICYHCRPVEQEMNTSTKGTMKKQHIKLKKQGEVSQLASKNRKLRVKNPKLQKLSSARLAAYGVL